MPRVPSQSPLFLLFLSETYSKRGSRPHPARATGRGFDSGSYGNRCFGHPDVGQFLSTTPTTWARSVGRLFKIETRSSQFEMHIVQKGDKSLGQRGFGEARRVGFRALEATVTRGHRRRPNKRSAHLQPKRPAQSESPRKTGLFCVRDGRYHYRQAETVTMPLSDNAVRSLKRGACRTSSPVSATCICWSQ